MPPFPVPSVFPAIPAGRLAGFLRPGMALILLVLPFLASAGSDRSISIYPTQGWIFGTPEEGQATSAANGPFVPRYDDGKLVTLVETRYRGSTYEDFESVLESAVELLRTDFGGATFGVDASTLAPVGFDGKMQAAILGMLRKTPALAEDLRSKGGIMTATFEIRPVMQPANANLYLHAIYEAESKQYVVKIFLDSPEKSLREDITGIAVDTP